MRADAHWCRLVRVARGGLVGMQRLAFVRASFAKHGANIQTNRAIAHTRPQRCSPACRHAPPVAVLVHQALAGAFFARRARVVRRGFQGVNGPCRLSQLRTRVSRWASSTGRNRSRWGTGRCKCRSQGRTRTAAPKSWSKTRSSLSLDRQFESFRRACSAAAAAARFPVGLRRRSGRKKASGAL